MPAPEYLFGPAIEIARLISEREFSCVEVVRAHLDRIEAVNPTLNAFCFTYPQEALEKARAAGALDNVRVLRFYPGRANLAGDHAGPLT